MKKETEPHRKESRVESLDDTVDHDPLDEVATEFAERYRKGERVSIEEYVHRYPELAAEIRDLFPTITAMERLSAKRTLESTTPSEMAPVQLGDYRVIGEIGRGGMGIVYEAEQITLGRRVAVKVLPQRALRRERDVQRFEREAQTAAKLHHSNIVPVFGVGQDEGHHYIVMQLIRGVGLDEILTEMKYRIADGIGQSLKPSTAARSSTVRRSAINLLEQDMGRVSTVVNSAGETLVMDRRGDVGRRSIAGDAPVPTPEQIRSSVHSEYYKNVARIGLQAAQALHYAHQHDTLHRDVKPGNLLLDDEGSVWIADFGLAKAMENDDVTCSGDLVGTLGYVAPERFRGETTNQSDVYSLGLTIHEMLTFRRAFDGEDRVAVMNQVANERLVSPRKLNPAVPRDLETIVLKAASHDPADRYQTAGEMADDLAAFLEDMPIQARRLSRAEHSVRWCRRNPGMVALAASVVAMAATAFSATVVGYFHADKERQRAEATAKLGLSALDNIYAQFAPSTLSVPVSGDATGNEEDLLLGSAQLPLSKDVAQLLENLLRFYDDLSAQATDSDLVAVKSIAANRRVGDIRRRLGESEDARASYVEAIERIDRLSPAVRETETVRLESARIHNGLGILLQERRDKQSVEAHRNAIALLDHETSTEAERFELARSLYLLHTAQRRDRRRGSDRHSDALERAKSILNALHDDNPHTPDYRFLLARCLLAEKSGCVEDGALNDRQKQAIGILESLLEQTPDNPDYQFEVGEAYLSIERNECWKHRKRRRTAEQLAQSEERLRRGLKATANLDTRHPNIPRYTMLKQRLHDLLAVSLLEQGRLTEAADEFLLAMQKQQLLVQQSYDPHDHESWLYHLQRRYGQLLRDLGKPLQAQRLLTETAAGLERLIALPESDIDRFHRHLAEKELSKTYVTLANIHRSLGETDRERALLRKAE